MREAPGQAGNLAANESWKNQRYEFRLVNSRPSRLSITATNDPQNISHSLSGNERNRFFLNTGKNFFDASLVSGADISRDGRSFALLDYDQDGWMDIALMSLNAPRFQLFKNQLGKIYPDRKSFKIRLRGTQSNRDAIGTTVAVHYADGHSMKLHRQTGQGFASQNSAALQISNPKDNPVQSLTIRWPSGVTEIIPTNRLAKSILLVEPQK